MSDKKNPAGLDGFAFLEFSSPDTKTLEQHFLHFGFTKTAQHKSKQVSLYQQNNINFIINNEPNSQAETHAKTHGAGACAMGFHVNNAKQAYDHTIKNGATPFNTYQQPGEATLLAIEAIGGSVIYFIDDTSTLFDTDFEVITKPDKKANCQLTDIDHLTHNVYQGNMDKWADFYFRLFNFFEIRFFDIKGQQTGLISRALSSPCGKIKIPLNESTDKRSQIEEFLTEYNGEGIQHIALSSANIYETIEKINHRIQFLDVPDTYYDSINERINWHKEDLPRLQKNKILIDGAKEESGGLLLQIFTENLLGPAFFEIIQRKGNDGFGEGNFQALFEAIERDQIRRGVL